VTRFVVDCETLLSIAAGEIAVAGTFFLVSFAIGAAAAAVLAFAGAVAVEYRKQNVRCNTILPSVVDTPANRAAMPNAHHERWPKAAQIAAVLAFLVSDDAELISGAAIPVYGRA
jgi:NAD(P)-dependent dehydrogenase (short-subunit alcohol dehydrogenase family)